MATKKLIPEVNSVQLAKVRQEPSEFLHSHEQNGRVRMAYATYEFTGRSVCVQMFNIPNCARILGFEVSHEALGEGTSASVGHACFRSRDLVMHQADSNAYASQLDTSKISDVPSLAAASLKSGRNSLVATDGSGFIVTLTGHGKVVGKVDLICYYVTD